MEHSRANAERVKPILQAMERTIEAVRRKRVAGPSAWTDQSSWNSPAQQPQRPSLGMQQNSGANPIPMNRANQPNAQPGAPTQSNTPTAPGSAPFPQPGQRLKARPKRIDGMSKPFPQDGYRSQAG
ncbi:MAG TPA: hypothetical protein VG711_06655 [Phycisphaerales bacterium]|nr:hypothetical protein [Phycisphaerales bacterium]